MKSGIRRWIVILSLAPSSMALAADGLSVPEGVWPSWQVRLSAHSPQPGPEALRLAPVPSVLGDYYFSVPRLLPLSREGGLRATSGVITTSGLRLPQLQSAADGTEPLPYVGLGYTHAALGGGWGFTADVGLVAENPAAAWRLGGAMLGSGPALDDAVRNLRLSPMIQLGVRYTF